MYCVEAMACLSHHQTSNTEKEARLLEGTQMITDKELACPFLFLCQGYCVPTVTQANRNSETQEVHLTSACVWIHEDLFLSRVYKPLQSPSKPFVGQGNDCQITL